MRAHRRGAILLLVGCVLLALIASGLVAWQFLRPEGGAASPEEAVQGLMTAVAQQDPVAALDMINPAEVDGFDQVYEAAIDRAVEEGLVDGKGKSDALDIAFDDLEFDTTGLTDGYARVVIADGTYDLSFDPERLPDGIADLVGDVPDGATAGDFSELWARLGLEGGDRPALSTIEIDDRWYVTLLGTYADGVYRSMRAAAPDLDLGTPDWDAADDVAPIVGTDVDEVVSNLVDALSSLDLQRVLRNLPVDLARPLLPYANVLQAGLQELQATLRASNVTVTTKPLDDGKVEVVIDHGYFEGSFWNLDDGRYTGAHVEIDDGCATAEGENGSGRLCLDDGPSDLGIDSFHVVIDEMDGGYQLDPVATLTDYATTIVQHATRQMVRDFLTGFVAGFRASLGQGAGVTVAG